MTIFDKNKYTIKSYKVQKYYKLNIYEYILIHIQFPSLRLKSMLFCLNKHDIE